jgi:hypothetical protein
MDLTFGIIFVSNNVIQETIFSKSDGNRFLKIIQEINLFADDKNVYFKKI